MASAKSEKREIYALALACEDLFLKCYATPHFLPSVAGETAEIQHERFRIWSSYLGVFASYKASLDKRLEYCDDIHNLVIQLLELMRKNLEFVTSRFAAHSMQNISISSALKDNQELQGTLSEALNAVEATITRLNKLGSAIRRQSATGIENRVQAFTEKHGDNDYTEFARQIVQFRYKTISPSLKEHLASSMAARRQRLRYLRRHQMKMESQAMKEEKEPGTLTDTNKTSSPALRLNEGIAGATPTSTPARQVWSKNVGLRTATIPAASETNATSFKPTQSVMARIRKASTGSIVSSSKESTTFMAEGLDDYPEPPKTHDGQARRPCPFCFQPLKASDLKTRHWKRHVNQDIKAFICLSAKCNEPPFETFDLWAKHMRDSHSNKWPQLVHKPVSWRCDVDHPKDMPAFEFDDENAFKEHLKAYHGNYSAAVQNSIFRISRVQRRRPPKTCLLCSYDVSALDSDQLNNSSPADMPPATKRPGDFEELDKLAKHIANHLWRLAFDSANNLDVESQDDVSLGSVLTSNGKQQSSPGSQQRLPSGLEILSQLSTDLSDNFPRHESSNSIPTFDKDWSKAEYDFLQSLDIELDDLSILPNWDDEQYTFKQRMQFGSQKGLDQQQPPAPSDVILEHFLACQNLANIVNFQQTADQCLAHLRVTDPRHDKKRIQDTKGGLLKDAYVWVLDNPDFCQWRNDQHQRLLWVKGDPGKGKTMLLCGIIDELEATRPQGPQGTLLSYFFCQATDERLNTATAVLRGLIFMLLDQDPSLVSHMKKKYDVAGKALFEDVNAWQAIYST
ncbi:Putative NACHT nucleoside triphosphatase [Colletotrichum destructivum]|uniref:NACHT nucleoside triphosphatase n=1 Tax=Colletotrichum destructivum TaxID=34406 RepID=A0AAX4I1U8_9PEZI|nr:Putative NACHT nucleoside triphosphatase [Colletotrichum destructivum]